MRARCGQCAAERCAGQSAPLSSRLPQKTLSWTTHRRTHAPLDAPSPYLVIVDAQFDHLCGSPRVLNGRDECGGRAAAPDLDNRISSPVCVCVRASCVDRQCIVGVRVVVVCGDGCVCVCGRGAQQCGWVGAVSRAGACVSGTHQATQRTATTAFHDTHVYLSLSCCHSPSGRPSARA
jgi:hypothetical protein